MLEAGGEPCRFEFATAQRIVFGIGTAADLPAIASAFGKRVFWVAGSSPQRHEALLNQVRNAVDAVDVFSVAGEPTLEQVSAGSRQLCECRSTVVVGVGGGSVIDAAKAIAALSANPGGPLEYLEVVGKGRPLGQPPLPMIAVPTTAGTGAEATRNAVLGVPSAGVKVSLRSPLMLPRVALVDPSLAIELPASITAATGMDALTQLIEAYLSCRANPLSDALCRDGIPRVAAALPVAVSSPGDLAARGQLALGALYSGMALANAGLGAVHGFAAPIGGMFAAPHGAVCAALLAPVLAANLAALRARSAGNPIISRFAEVAAWVGGAAADKPEDAAAICSSLVSKLGILPLGKWGVGVGDLDILVQKATAASSMKGNPLPLTAAELESILRQVI
jgi:alcohol dehydrogenase class IV